MYLRQQELIYCEYCLRLVTPEKLHQNTVDNEDLLHQWVTLEILARHERHQDFFRVVKD